MEKVIHQKQHLFPTSKKVFLFLCPVILILLISINTSKISAQTLQPEDAPDIEDEGFGDDFDDEYSDAAKEVFDPLSGYNRIMTGFNDGFVSYVLLPVAKGYSRVIPKGIRRGTSRFFKNILFPVRFVNNVLQIKIKNAGEETLRFTVNSTIGILGFWDPANKWFNLQSHEEDFGQTLGYYGVGSGFHIVLPFYGPSNIRDSICLLPDRFLQPVGQYKPIGQLDNTIQELAVESFVILNRNSLHIKDYKSLKKDAVELYPFLREIYEQRRIKQIEE